MEWGCIGFLLGAIVCLIFFGMGVWYGGQEEQDDVPDIKIYVPSRNKPTAQEIEDVLYTLRIGASNKEKKVIDHLIDKEGKE